MRYRVDISRIVRVRQIVSTTVEAENEDQALELAEQASEEGQLDWASDDFDIPEPEDDSYAFDIEPVKTD